MTMQIENLFPAAIGAISDLPTRLRAEGQVRGLSEADCDALVALLPSQLAAAGCFLDRLTSLWKYEFGEPARIGHELLWGHLWTPVPLLRIRFCRIWTDLRQEEGELAAAFESLDARKVHFAIVGDAKPDIHLLTRRPSDRDFLIGLFAANEGTRFTFRRGCPPHDVDPNQ
jgi:hypothetical protein